MRPWAGAMFGMSRTVAQRRTFEFEYMRIEEHDSLLVYVATPSRQEVAVFRQAALTDSLVEFSNPQHDFPQIIRYRRMPDGSVLAQIEGEARGRKRTVDFPMQRVPCDGPPPEPQ